jgi:hypothetical protein
LRSYTFVVLLQHDILPSTNLHFAQGLLHDFASKASTCISLFRIYLTHDPPCTWWIHHHPPPCHPCAISFFFFPRIPWINALGKYTTTHLLHATLGQLAFPSSQESNG